MQLKFAIDETAPANARNSTAQYGVAVVCNKCAGIHEVGLLITLEDGPVAKQSIGDLYDGKSLPKSLANLANTSITCPRTGRQSTQKDLHQIFLVPTKS
jgi:hypothetical protein